MTISGHELEKKMITPPPLNKGPLLIPKFEISARDAEDLLYFFSPERHLITVLMNNEVCHALRANIFERNTFLPTNLFVWCGSHW